MLCKVIGNTNSKIAFIFFNGFGSDYTYWNNLVPKFLNYTCVMLSENYFNAEDVDINDLKPLLQNKYVIGVGHSLGYEKLCFLQQKYDFIKLNKIVSMEGFSCYLGNNPILKPHRKSPLEWMKSCYAINPIGTLMGFQIYCGQIPPLVPTSVNRKLLFADLDLLDSGVEPPDIPHLVLSSIDDQIIPFYIIEDNFRDLPDVEIIYTNGTGHLLGLKEPYFAYKKIIDFALKDI